MTPHQLIEHYDSGALWPEQVEHCPDLASAYQRALLVRALRRARGELPLGFKIGFTNRTIWPRYQVFAPIWSTVWSSTVSHADSEGTVSLAATCQPRLEPEVVFGLRHTPAPNASLDDVFDALDWLAPGFEVVQSHQPDWKFSAPDTVMDHGLHARLLIGRRLDVRALASDATQLADVLANAQVELRRGDGVMERGCGNYVLGSPLHALHHFLTELRRCPGAPDLLAGDVVTTGTWTDAWPVAPGEAWSATFSAPLPALSVRFE